MERNPDLDLQKLDQERKLKEAGEKLEEAEEEVLNSFIDELYTIERRISDQEETLQCGGRQAGDVTRGYKKYGGVIGTQVSQASQLLSPVGLTSVQMSVGKGQVE